MAAVLCLLAMLPLLVGNCVTFVGAGKEGEGRTPGFERKMKEVKMDVTAREKDRPGLLRSSMYHRAGLTRARVRVSWRVDCQGRRRCHMYVSSKVLHKYAWFGRKNDQNVR